MVDSHSIAATVADELLREKNPQHDLRSGLSQVAHFHLRGESLAGSGGLKLQFDRGWRLQDRINCLLILAEFLGRGRWRAAAARGGLPIEINARRAVHFAIALPCVG